MRHTFYLRYLILFGIIFFSNFASAVEKTSIFPSEKHIWKQCGPGSFEVKDGVATAKDGMGLWWYSTKAFKNATFSFQFKTKTPEANSGVFVRFADPGAKPMAAVWSGYEIQIQNQTPSDINTGSIYNIQAPSHVPLKPNGEWNQYEITTYDQWILVVLNGELINVFKTKANRGDKEGYFGLQNHDPESIVSFKDIEVQEWNTSDSFGKISKALGIKRADWSKYWSKLPGKTRWFQQTDVGPALSSTVGDIYHGENRVSALKGLNIELSKLDRSYAIFDKELLKVSNAGLGELGLKGTAWNGSHGGYPSIDIDGYSILQTGSKAGWSTTKNFADPREIQGHGNLPKEQGRFLGQYRYGDKAILHYSAGGAKVLEKIDLFYWNKTPALSRELEVDPADKDRWMLLTDIPKGKIRISEDGKSASILHEVDETITKPIPQRGVKIVQDRTEGDWDTLVMGAPSKNDFLQSQKEIAAYPRVIPGFADAHKNAGDEEGVAIRLFDGTLPENERGRASNFYFADVQKEGRIEIRFKKATKIQRIHSYSWHRNFRSPQRYSVYVANSDKADPRGKNLRRSGWKFLASVDTSKLGQGGKHGVALSGEKDLLTSGRKLLFIAQPAEKGGKFHTFFSELDIFTAEAPKMDENFAFEAKPAVTHVATKAIGPNVKLEDLGNNILALRIPKGEKGLINIGICRVTHLDAAKDPSDLFSSVIPDPKPLSPYTKGGPSRYPETIPVKGELSNEKSAWVTDTIPLPEKNPWIANLRIGDFDFFADGNSAAICTWNGDVWIVDGLLGDWKKLTWRRFATGLFEPLGLRIVKDKIYVNGRDQITRLHDLNKDGEADFYECFNNDIIITKNFHEFTFSLQTDKQGNFYITKGAPVRAGGRGFEKIVPHNGIVGKISPDGEHFEVIATGLRAPGGLGVGPNGEITTGENEGTWQPCCKLNYFTGKDAFLGVEDTAHGLSGQKMTLPLCYFPMSIDNSGGGQVWVPENAKWGLHPGELIHLSYGKSTLYRVLKESVDGIHQGGVVKIPIKLRSSAQRARFHKDGSLYVSGFRGWQTNAANPFALQRVRHIEQAIDLPDQLKVTDKGIYLRFEKELDAKAVADINNYSVQRWKYIRSKQYGSGQFSIDNPDLKAEKQAYEKESKKYRKRDKVPVVFATVLSDKKTLFLHIPTMKVAEQMQLDYAIKFADGSTTKSLLTHTVHALNKHSDESLLKFAEGAGQTQVAGIAPGLIQTISVGLESDQRITRLPAQFIGKGDKISDMLPAGVFLSEWSGFLSLDKKMEVQFALEGAGQASLSIAKQNLLSEKGTFSKSLSKKLTLNPGLHPISLKLNSSKDGLGSVRLLWQSNDTPLQSIKATYFKHKPNAQLASALRKRQGRDLLLSNNCAQCHTTNEAHQLSDISFQGPNLSGVGSRLDETWMAHWVADPKKLNPHAKMPKLIDTSTEKGKQQAADVAAYLASLKSDNKAAPFAEKKDDLKKGGQLFHALGCVGCHDNPDQASKDMIPLNNVAFKYDPAALQEYLLTPEKHYAMTSMPNFKLSKDEASSLATFLTGRSKGKQNKLAKLPAKGNASEGKKWVKALNCASCHEGIGAANELPSLDKIIQTNWKKGSACLEKGKNRVTGQPHPDFTKEQLEAIYDFKSHTNPTESLKATSLFDYSKRQSQQLRCDACHKQDNKLSLLSKRHAITEKFKSPHTKEHGGVDQSRPHLSFIGEMLHTSYMEKVLKGELKESPRPWLAMRMPAFPARGKELAQGLTAEYGLAPSKPIKTPLDKAKVEIGKTLIGSNGGFACNICHANGPEKATAAFEVEGVNFDRVFERLRPGYYHKWMENPQSITPDSRMPRYTTGNKSPLPYLDADAKKQFDAIYEYCKSLSK